MTTPPQAKEQSTPRTDKVTLAIKNLGHDYYDLMRRHAEHLERELSAATERLNAKVPEVEDMCRRLDEVDRGRQTNTSHVRPFSLFGEAADKLRDLARKVRHENIVAENALNEARDLGRRLAAAEQKLGVLGHMYLSGDCQSKGCQELVLKGQLSEAVAKEKRYNWLRENGDKGIYILQNWSHGDAKPILALAQGAELDSIIDTHLAAAIRQGSGGAGMAKTFENCRFEECDLPGQCIAEGKCHHADPTFEYRTRIATLEASLEASLAAAERDAGRLRKLKRWMSSNVKEGWSEVKCLGAIAVYAHKDFNAYLDDLPECNFGLCETAALATKERKDG